MVQPRSVLLIEQREHAHSCIQFLLQTQGTPLFAPGRFAKRLHSAQLLIQQGAGKCGKKVTLRFMQRPCKHWLFERVLKAAGQLASVIRQRFKHFNTGFQGVTQHQQALLHLPRNKHHTG